MGPCRSRVVSHLDTLLRSAERASRAEPLDPSHSARLVLALRRAGRTVDAWLTAWRAGLPPDPGLSSEVAELQRPAIEGLGGRVPGLLVATDTEQSFDGERPRWRWRDLDGRVQGPVLAVFTPDGPGANDDDLLAIAAIPGLSELEVGHGRWTLGVFDRLPRSLILNCHVGYLSADQMSAGAIGLSRPDVLHAGIPGDVALETLVHVSRARSLNLFLARVTETGLRTLGRCTWLEELRLWITTDPSLLRGPDLASLLGEAPLRRLSVDCLRGQLRDVAGAVQSIGELETLERLDLNGLTLADPMLEDLGGLTRLRHLTLRCPALTATGLETVEDCPLERLSLICSGVGLDLAGTIARMNRLRGLRIFADRIEPDAADMLFALPGLEALDLQAPDRLLTSTTRCSSALRSLRLCGPAPTAAELSSLTRSEISSLCVNVTLGPASVGDDALAEVALNPRLERLHIAGAAGVTDRGLGRLVDLQGLQEVSLMRAPLVTREAVAALQSALPACDVSVSSGWGL